MFEVKIETLRHFLSRVLVLGDTIRSMGPMFSLEGEIFETSDPIVSADSEPAFQPSGLGRARVFRTP